jgi:hypothetical protein
MDKEIKITIGLECQKLPSAMTIETYNIHKYKVLSMLNNYLALNFCGYSSYEHIGAYIMNDNSLANEQAITYTIITNKDSKDLKEYLMQVRNGLFQECILYTEKSLNEVSFI